VKGNIKGCCGKRIVDVESLYLTRHFANTMLLSAVLPVYHFLAKRFYKFIFVITKKSFIDLKLLYLRK
jgi:hypothetical protein